MRMGKPPRIQHQLRKGLPLVCIGGSAGGLNAYTKLLQNLPHDLGAAVVIINHVARVETLLHHVLPRFTRMSVDLIHDHLVPAPNRVFIIPSNRELHVNPDGEFRIEPLTKRYGWPDVITRFLRSVATHWEGQVIAVIVSGLDGDGAAALCDLKKVGAITIAQHPSTADWPDMPMSAIQSGCIDYVDSPDDIGRALTEMVGSIKRLG
jgi:two-component system, chemotaxis family, protein-glutamate methylesterase/glutaminase